MVEFITENLMMTFRIFDEMWLNIIVLGVIWKRFAYISAWKITRYGIKKNWLKTRNSKSTIHFISRFALSYIFAWLIKISLVIILFTPQKFIQGFLMSAFIIVIYYWLKYCNKEYWTKIKVI